MKKLVGAILFFFCFAALAKQPVMDSLFAVLKKQPRADTNKFSTLYEIAFQYNTAGDFSNSMAYLEKCQRIADSLKYSRGLAKVHNSIGVLYLVKGDIPKAIDHQLQSLKYYETYNDRNGIAKGYFNLGTMHFYNNNMNQALSCWKNSLRLYEALKNEFEIASVEGNLAAFYSNRRMFDSSEYFFKRVISYYEKSGMEDEAGMAYGNMGAVYMQKKDIKSALKYSFKALGIARRTNKKLDMALCYSNIGSIYAEMKKYREALAYNDSGLTCALSTGSREKIAAAYTALEETYLSMKNYKKADEYLHLYMLYNDSLHNENSMQAIAEMQARYESEKKEKEILLLSKDKQITNLSLKSIKDTIKRRRIIIYAMIAGLALVSVFAFFIFSNYKRKQKLNLALEETNLQLAAQNKLIEEKNLQISDSIEYASDIQRSVFPTEAEFKLLFPQSFVYYVPKDVVSGDFYWIASAASGEVPASVSSSRQSQAEPVRCLAVCDCTGHGVPGGFMTMMAFNLMENIAHDSAEIHPARFLDEINESLARTFVSQNQYTSSKFGLDISMICFDPVSMRLRYAGSHTPLCIVRNGTLTELKADNATPGITKEHFTEKEMTLEKGDMLYLFTDGFADQFGGAKREKFFSYRLKDMLVTISGNPVYEQKEMIARVNEEWKGKNEQTDDILLIGIRV
jgi:serine phosphatase RsbU (regulator of sigma subunit)